MKKQGQSQKEAQIWMYLERKVQCRKEKFCMNTWNVRSMNQGVVEHEMTRLSFGAGLSILQVTSTCWNSILHQISSFLALEEEQLKSVLDKGRPSKLKE